MKAAEMLRDAAELIDNAALELPSDTAREAMARQMTKDLSSISRRIAFCVEINEAGTEQSMDFDHLQKEAERIISRNDGTPLEVTEEMVKKTIETSSVDVYQMDDDTYDAFFTVIEKNLGRIFAEN